MPVARALSPARTRPPHILTFFPAAMILVGTILLLVASGVNTSCRGVLVR